MSQRRSRKVSRPSTAPSKEDVPLLPSSSSSSSFFLSPANPHMGTLAESDDSSENSSSRPHTQPPTPNETTSIPHESIVNAPPPPPPPSSTAPFYRHNYSHYSYDWATFITAYASGRWDPHKTPNPPLASINHPHSSPSIGLGINLTPLDTRFSKSRQSSGEDDISDFGDAYEQPIDDVQTPTASSLDTPTSSHRRIGIAPTPTHIYPAVHRTRNSFSASLSTPTPQDMKKQSLPTLPALSTLPVTTSLSAGSNQGRSTSASGTRSQKAKADLFLPLPHRLPIMSTTSQSSGLTSPSQFSAAIQSNALFPNTPHSEVETTKKPAPALAQSSTHAPSIYGNNNLPSSPHTNRTHTATSSRQTQPEIPRLSLPTPNTTSNPSPSSSTASSSPPTQHVYLPLNHHSTSPPFQSNPHLNLNPLNSFNSHYITPSNIPKFPHVINAATMRLASSNVNISPLALPSPEHELTDPMRSVCVTVPGTVPDADGEGGFAVGDGGTMSEGGGVDALAVAGANGLGLGGGVASASSSSPSSSSSSVHTPLSHPHHHLHAHSPLSQTYPHTQSHHRRNPSSGPGSSSSWETSFSGSVDEQHGMITTPGGTTKRVRLSMEWKKFWEGTKDVDVPKGHHQSNLDGDPIGPLDTVESSSSLGRMKRSGSRGRSSQVSASSSLGLVTAKEEKEGRMEDDYFSRGGEFSASASYSNSRESSVARSTRDDEAGATNAVMESQGQGQESEMDTPSEIKTLRASPPSSTTSSATATQRGNTPEAEYISDQEENGNGKTKPKPPGPLSFSSSSSSASSTSASSTSTTTSTSNTTPSSTFRTQAPTRQQSIPIPAPMLPSYSYPYPYTQSQVLLHPTGAMTVPVPVFGSATTTIHANVNANSNSNPAHTNKVVSPAPSVSSSASSSVDVGEISSVGTGTGTGTGYLPRRVNLTRQTSAPLPSTVMNTTKDGTLNVFEGVHSYRVGRSGMLPTLPSLPSLPSGLGSEGEGGEEEKEKEKEKEEGKGGESMQASSMSGTGGQQQQQQGQFFNGGDGGIGSASIGPGVGASVVVPGPGIRSVKEEQMFHEVGYLVPPYPPDELERRRALYKFNIWNTGSDLNFDRIAHLAKLVFNTKGVFISLLDGTDQWFKSQWGLKLKGNARIHSLCAHTILQRDDEPMVVLDTLADWRFAKNPHVTGVPQLRFYAGAPLRTQDGYNVGTLAVIDDAPRDEFTPRHRHTLKEFTAIAMREMELWRDKIQLRIRDRIQSSMEQFSRECLEIDMEQDSQEEHNRSRASSSQGRPSPEPSSSSSGSSPDLLLPSSMDRVYDRAAKLVQRTLDVEGVIVMDVSSCEVLESMSAESSVTVVMHHGDPDAHETTTKMLTAEEYGKLSAFFAKYPDGRISEGFVPPSFRQFLPARIQYALTVPIFNVDKRPFALVCAYNASEHTKRFLEGHELSYLRAIGVIILSAVLKRRMILADKAKSLFISNISHELRTPLHGILAAAELLTDSDLNHSQVSFLQTVQACGTSLVETVNHVLDFTKLSGNSKAGGVENAILPTKVDLMQLVEDAVDGCWIGHRARTAIMEDTGTGIGSVYSPPKEDNPPSATRRKHVETVIDIGERKEGWVLKCEKGGIRRVLMNVFGNSLKFTSDGFVHVMLRQVPEPDNQSPNRVRIELSVLDTGKGISSNFLKNQLFHPFSQENPLQTGTGLGLAIVNSIVTSESVGGKVDVWSEEGVGTEIKVTFHAEILDNVEETTNADASSFKFDDAYHPPTVSLVGFDSDHRGVQLLRSVLVNYLVSSWGFDIKAGSTYGDIVILNEDVGPVIAATESHDTSRPFIVLSASRGSPTIMSVASQHERIGGFCRVIYKPGGPSRIRSVLKLCLHTLKIASGMSAAGTPAGLDGQLEENHPRQHPLGPGFLFPAMTSPPRRNSEEATSHLRRPSMSPRSTTAHPKAPTSWTTRTARTTTTVVERVEEAQGDEDSVEKTIPVGPGGSLLKSSVGSIQSNERKAKILVVEDNSILRNLLVKWLKSKGYDFRDAVDGRDGVNVYSKEGPFDVVLLDLSMPVLDGIGATAEIRQFESNFSKARHSRIVALTGMSSLEDKRKAFEAGVDGYLVKPVAFKTLDEMLHKLGIS